MQRILALNLETAANGAYTVSREDEVADLNADIRLIGADGKHRVVIDIKIGDKRWSIADFEHALEHQLVGQYLRHARTQAGIMLLTYNGTTSDWPVAGGNESLDFEALPSSVWIFVPRRWCPPNCGARGGSRGTQQAGRDCRPFRSAPPMHHARRCERNCVLTDDASSL
jgi:hypothetical protein